MFRHGKAGAIYRWFAQNCQNKCPTIETPGDGEKRAFDDHVTQNGIKFWAVIEQALIRRRSHLQNVPMAKRQCIDFCKKWTTTTSTPLIITIPDATLLDVLFHKNSLTYMPNTYVATTGSQIRMLTVSTESDWESCESDCTNCGADTTNISALT